MTWTFYMKIWAICIYILYEKYEVHVIWLFFLGVQVKHFSLWDFFMSISIPLFIIIFVFSSRMLFLIWSSKPAAARLTWWSMRRRSPVRRCNLFQVRRCDNRWSCISRMYRLFNQNRWDDKMKKKISKKCVCIRFRGVPLNVYYIL